MLLEEKKERKKEVFVGKKDEKILVVPREKILKDGSFWGIKPVNFDYYEKVISKYKKFIWRSEAEINPQFKQIIPYLIFNYEDKFFLMKRRKNASEVRLQSKYSLGIGGHIREEDILDNNIYHWAKREFFEEIDYAGDLNISPLGLLNDDSNEVGKVHLGFVFLLKGSCSQIKIKTELQEGRLLNLHECQPFYSDMENWSKIIFNFLKNIF